MNEHEFYKSTSSMSGPDTYISKLDPDNEITDEDIENFFGEKPFSQSQIPECSHMSQVKPVPSSGIDIRAPCARCGSETDNWICLSCYDVFCSRYVNEHMLEHTANTKHPIVLSFSDISVWCYGCDDFVDHDTISEAKNIVLTAKYGSPTDGITLQKTIE